MNNNSLTCSQSYIKLRLCNMKITKLKNYAKIAGGVLTGYPKITVDGLTGLMTDKLKDKSIELLRDNPAMRDIEENITKTVDDTKEILGIKEFERRLNHIVSPFKQILRH